MPTENRIDWNAVRSEYVAGGTSYRKLAEKYKISRHTVTRRAIEEKWTEQRASAAAKAAELIQQKTAIAAADNAAIAQRIKSKLLLRLEKEIDKLPEGQIGSMTYKQSERVRIDEKGRPVKERGGIEYKLREFAAAYKDLTADMQIDGNETGSALLQSLYELEKERRGQ